MILGLRLKKRLVVSLSSLDPKYQKLAVQAIMIWLVDRKDPCQRVNLILTRKWIVLRKMWNQREILRNTRYL